MINRLLAMLRRQEEGVEPAKPVAPTTDPSSILIVDDNAGDLSALSLALENEGHRIDTANSAVVAKWKLSGSAYDLIVLNPKMLDTDGNHFARHLLTDERLSAVPVAALAGSGPRLRTQTGCSGAYDAVVSRPFDATQVPQQLRAVLTAMRDIPADSDIDLPYTLHMSQDRRQDGLKLLQAIEDGLPDAQFASDTPTALRQLINCVRGLQLFELADYVRRAAELSQARTARARARFRLLIRLCRDPLLLGPDSIPELADLRTGYLEKRSAELGRLEFALEAADYGTLGTIGHNLKGTGAAYGFGELTELGRALEAAAKNEDGAAVGDLLLQMEAYVSAARPSA